MIDFIKYLLFLIIYYLLIIKLDKRFCFKHYIFNKIGTRKKYNILIIALFSTLLILLSFFDTSLIYPNILGGILIGSMLSFLCY